MQTKLKFTLIHSYSDFNKGDAGIVLGTIKLLREISADCKINLVSTFSKKDIRFEKEHFISQKHADCLLSALFPEPFLKIGNKYFYNNISKLLAFVGSLLKYFFVYILINNKSRSIFLNRFELNTYSKLKDSDFIISKGGSFLYSDGSLRSFAIFSRMVYIFFLLKKMNKRVIILGQSIGPFKDRFSKFLIRKILPRLDMVFYREELTPKYLQNELDLTIDNSSVITDLAFYLFDKNAYDLTFRSDIKVLGITARPHMFKNYPHDMRRNMMDKYIESLYNCAIDFIKKENYAIKLIQQVDSIFDGENDLIALEKLFELFKKTKYIKNVSLIKTSLLTPYELKQIYSSCSMLLATRLHSAIFALTEGVPALVISYQGTKAKGIFDTYDLGGYVAHIDKLQERIFPTILELKQKFNKTKTIKKIIFNNAELHSKLVKYIEKL